MKHLSGDLKLEAEARKNISKKVNTKIAALKGACRSNSAKESQFLTFALSLP